MIRMIQSISASHAKSYFTDALQKSDYFINDQELPGQFMGRLSDRIGISGTADKNKFNNLCENINPITGGTLTPKTLAGRTVGYDINFHCPKSVSIVHALSNDTHVLDAFQNSVRETMKDIEADSMTRVRKNGAYEDRHTGELLYAEFIHQTARPSDDAAPDPHLHAHCFVMNATWDDKESKIKAGQFREIKRDMPYYQERFLKRLSDNLIDLGYNVRRTDKAFEIVGIPKGSIDMLSKRTNEIGEFAKKHGITDKKTLNELGARTRSKKQKGMSMDELKVIWKTELRESAMGSVEDLGPLRYAPKIEVPQQRAKDYIEYSLEHSFERASVVNERRLLATSYRQSIGNKKIGLEEITDSLLSNNELIRVKEQHTMVCTKKDVLSEEMEMVKLARNGQSKFSPLYMTTPPTSLNGLQGEAIKHVLTTKHQVSIIRGGAGTGKTTLLKELDELVSRTGKEMFFVAPTAQASRGVLASEGFKGAETVAKLLADQKLQNKIKRGILCVDEAGLLGTTDMKSLLELVNKQDARLILVGDTRQHSSVVRGDALRVLNTIGNIKTAEVTEIHRQKNVLYKNAVQDLVDGNIAEGFLKLDDMGAIKTIDPLNPNEILIGDYIKTIKKGMTALIVSPTNKQAEKVSEDLRNELRKNGMLGKTECKVSRFSSLNFTEAQKTDWRNYQPGQLLQFKQHTKRIQRGSSWTVVDAKEAKIVIENDKGRKEAVPRSNPNSFDVYDKGAIKLSKNDKVKITRNIFDKDKKRLNNGQLLEVARINRGGEIVLTNPISKTSYRIPKGFGFIDYSYCTTSHSSQGKNVDEVFISQPASTFEATNAKQFYVSVSRGKHGVSIYTDDKEELLKNALEMGDRQSAIELVNPSDKHIHHILLNERKIDELIPNDVHKNIELENNQTREDYEPGL